MGDDGAGGFIQVVVGLGSGRSPSAILRWSDRAGCDHLGDKWAWRCRRPRLLQNNTLNEILVFDLSLATGLYALTSYAGTVMGTRRRRISRSLRDVSD